MGGWVLLLVGLGCDGVLVSEREGGRRGRGWLAAQSGRKGREVGSVGRGRAF